MTRRQVLDLYFVEARSKLVDVAAFLDRAQRADGPDDFRLRSFRAALGRLRSGSPDRARRVLASLSDPTAKPVKAAGDKSACGAWPGRPRLLAANPQSAIRNPQSSHALH